MYPKDDLSMRKGFTGGGRESTTFDRCATEQLCFRRSFLSEGRGSLHVEHSCTDSISGGGSIRRTSSEDGDGDGGSVTGGDIMDR